MRQTKHYWKCDFCNRRVALKSQDGSVADSFHLTSFEFGSLDFCNLICLEKWIINTETKKAFEDKKEENKSLYHDTDW